MSLTLQASEGAGLAHVVFVGARAPAADLDPPRAHAYASALRACFGGSPLARRGAHVSFPPACACGLSARPGLEQGSAKRLGGQQAATAQRGSADALNPDSHSTSDAWALRDSTHAAAHGSAPEGPAGAEWLGTATGSQGLDASSVVEASGAGAPADEPFVSWFLLPDAPSLCGAAHSPPLHDWQVCSMLFCAMCTLGLGLS